MIFVSYKHEDAGRIAPLVQALEAEGFQVWWDHDLTPADSWRTQITDALTEAQVVLVAWNHESTGPAGDFVRDEAAGAKRRGVLVPVLLDRVDPPLGFGEIQAVDLVRWSGRRSDPFFQDLVGLLRAKRDGTPPPSMRGPRLRAIRRGITLGGLFAALSTVISLVRSLPICTLPVFQPDLADTCGALGLDHPTRAERLAYVAATTCDGLRAFLDQHPTSPLQDEVQARLAARRVVIETRPDRKPLALYASADAPSEPAARAALAEQAQQKARDLCEGFAATQSFTLDAAAPEGDPTCTRDAGTVRCVLDGRAQCTLQVKVDREDCGS